MRLGKTQSKVTPDAEVILSRRMIGLEQSLMLDRERCCGCGDCEMVCPTGAVSITEPVVAEGRVLKKAVVDIDPAACTYCGECVALCPTKALSWRENEETVPTVITEGIMPVLDEEIEIDSERCVIDCKLACRESCPLGAIEVTIEDDESGEARITHVAVDREGCLYCRRCEPACPYGLIQVKKSRTGLVVFNREACPSGCMACTEVCPTRALYREGDEVRLNEDTCIYCRACTRVCPADDALEVRREMIRGRCPTSQLWADMLEKLVSPAARLRHIQETAAIKRARAYRTRID
ncbi:MAG: 4Fe-4S dicluster domain-containing protein [Deltaproteobacteria bacterium]